MKTKFITIITIILLILWSCSSNNTNEIDRLAEKYKDKDTYEMFTTNGKILSSVAIVYNADKLPWRITLQGNTENPEGLAEIISGLAFEKMKIGYNSDVDSSTFNRDYIYKHLSYYYHILRKDSLVFALYSKMKLDTLYEERIVKLSYDFAITNADESRKLGNNSKIDF